METGIDAKISNVHLLHARDNAGFVSKIKEDIEDGLELENHVNVKRRFKSEDNVAEEILRPMEKLEGEGEDSRAVIIISKCLFEVMKNNQERSQAFQNILLRDLHKPRGKHQFAVLRFDDVSESVERFREVFSQEFVDCFIQGGRGLVVRHDDTSQRKKIPQVVREQWFGPEAHVVDVPMEEAPAKIDTSDIETVRIVHGGAKQAVREIGTELEEGFQLEDTIKYKLYNRVSVDKIPEIVMAELRNIREEDGPMALGVIVWCERFLNIMKESRFSKDFEDLLATLDPQRLVHLYLGVSEYEVKRYFPELTQMGFVRLDLNEDRTVEVVNLTPRVLHELNQPRRTPKKEERNSMAGMPSPSQQKPDRPPSSAERQSSEISEPTALASEESQRPQPLVARPPFQHVEPSLGLVGNPSNQNPQGGRVVLPAGDSFGMSSAGYTSRENGQCAGAMGQGNNGRLQAQPTDDSSEEGQRPQNWKLVANNGHSFNDFPSRCGVDPQSQGVIMANGIGHHDIGSYNPSDSSGSINNVQMMGPGAANGPPSAANPRVHLQASSSGSSTNGDRYLADGEHSMPLTMFPSGTFGSREPVLPSRDTTVESHSSPGRSPDSSMTSGNNQQHLSSLQANIMSCPQPPESNQSQFSGAPSSQPPTNRWAPSDCRSTEMASSGFFMPNEVAHREAINYPSCHPQINRNPNPHFLGDTQRPFASKIPRRGEAADITSASSAAPESLGSQGACSLPTMSVNNLSESCPSGQPPYSSMSNNATADSYRPSFSAAQSNNFNISGLASALGGQPATPGGNPFVQCSADSGDGTYANNQPSQDAFKQQDYRDIGPGQNLPNQQVGPQFMSHPAGQRCGNEAEGGERVHTSPARLRQTAREAESPSPPEQPLKDMEYACRQHLCIMLDPETNTGSDWKVFAYHFRMGFDMVRYVQCKRTSQTHELLNWLIEKKPDVTCGDFKQVARQKQRLDVVRKMEKFRY